MARSEDQGEELVSSVYIGGLPSSGTSVGEKIVVGSGTGVLTLWEKGVWDDQDDRIYVGRSRSSGEGEALESLTVIPDELGYGKMIAVGQNDGRIALVRIGQNKVVSRIQHDEIEGVTALGFDVEGRMISGGGQIVKVWHEAEGATNGVLGKHMMDDSDDDNDSDGDRERDDSDDSDKEKADKQRKKKKRTKGKGGNAGQHVMAFADMD